MLTGGAEGQAIISSTALQGRAGSGGQRQKTGLILELGLAAQSSHLSRRLQETAGSYDEKKEMGNSMLDAEGKGKLTSHSVMVQIQTDWTLFNSLTQML